MCTLRELGNWLGHQPRWEDIVNVELTTAESIHWALHHKDWASQRIENYDDLLIKTFGPSLEQCISLLRKLEVEHRSKLKYRRHKLPTRKLVRESYPEIMNSLRQGKWFSDGIQTFTELINHTFGLTYAMNQLQDFEKKHNKLPTKKLLKGVYPWILDALQRRLWLGDGIRTYSDLLEKTFGKTNQKQARYVGEAGLINAMTQIRELADVHDGLLTYTIVKRKARGILKALERKEWVDYNICTFTQLRYKSLEVV
ncbi:MAG: hypothetical protein ACFFBD_17090, partial [Candidatus Hodarchaeota archaeon]